MKDFIQILRRFVPPYKKYLFLNIFFNIFSTVLSLFSFALIIPILEILFKMKEISYNFIPWETTGMDLKDIAINNFYWFITEQINTHSEAWALMILRKISVAGPSGKAYVLSFCSGKAWAYKRSASASMNG